MEANRQRIFFVPVLLRNCTSRFEIYHTSDKHIHTPQTIHQSVKWSPARHGHEQFRTGCKTAEICLGECLGRAFHVSPSSWRLRSSRRSVSSSKDDRRNGRGNQLGSVFRMVGSSRNRKPATFRSLGDLPCCTTFVLLRRVGVVQWQTRDGGFSGALL